MFEVMYLDSDTAIHCEETHHGYVCPYPAVAEVYTDNWSRRFCKVHLDEARYEYERNEVEE